MWYKKAKGYEVAQKDMIWFIFQLFCLTADHPQTSDVTSLSLSFLICEMGPVLPVSLLWGLEIISIRVQHRAWCTDFTPQEMREPMCTCKNDGAELDGPSWEMRDVSRALGTWQVEMSPGWFHGRVCLGWAWENGQNIDRLWEEGWFHMEEKLWRKAGLLLLYSQVQPSSSRVLRLAHIYHLSSLLRAVYCESSPLLKGPWCASGQMASNLFCHFLACL